MITREKLLEITNRGRYEPDIRNPRNDVAGFIQLCEEWVKPNSVVVECGTWDGVSAAVFAFFAKKVITIDFIPKPTHILAHFDNVTKIHSDSVIYAREIPDRTVDVVYLDSDHSFKHVVNEIWAWQSKLKVGGIISGHDYDSASNPEVVEAVDYVFGKPDKVYSDGSWVVRP